MKATAINQRLNRLEKAFGAESSIVKNAKKWIHDKIYDNENIANENKVDYLTDRERLRTGAPGVDNLIKKGYASLEENLPASAAAVYKQEINRYKEEEEKGIKHDSIPELDTALKANQSNKKILENDKIKEELVKRANQNAEILSQFKDIEDAVYDYWFKNKDSDDPIKKGYADEARDLLDIATATLAWIRDAEAFLEKVGFARAESAFSEMGIKGGPNATTWGDPYPDF